MIELTAPQYLLLLLVVLPLLAWVAYQARVGSRGEGLASLCMLAVSVSLLCLALTEPKFVGRSTNRERMVVVAYDVSASVGDAAARASDRLACFADANHTASACGTVALRFRAGHG